MEAVDPSGPGDRVRSHEGTGKYLAPKRIGRIAAVALVSLALYFAGYIWFVRSHTRSFLHSDEVQVSDSPLDSILLFVFYPALWFDERYIGIYDTGHFTHFARVHAADRSEISGTHISPFVTDGDYPLPARPEVREFLLIAASLVCNVSVVSGAFYLYRRFGDHDERA